MLPDASISQAGVSKNPVRGSAGHRGTHALRPATARGGACGGGCATYQWGWPTGTVRDPTLSSVFAVVSTTGARGDILLIRRYVQVQVRLATLLVGEGCNGVCTTRNNVDHKVFMFVILLE
jgi:hypothetical protein